MVVLCESASEVLICFYKIHLKASNYGQNVATATSYVIIPIKKYFVSLHNFELYEMCHSQI